MLNLLRAEVQKVIGNGMLTSFTLWVWPVGAFAFVAVMVLFSVATPPDNVIFAVTPWDQSMPAMWSNLTGFPGSVLARLFPISFLAVFFAAEYDWGTWKNIVPRRRRPLLMFSKVLVLSTLVVLSFAAASLVWGVGMGVFAAVSGQTYGPALTAEVLNDFVPLYLFEAALAFGTTLVLAGFCALAALLTRTIVGGLVLGLAMSTIESVSGLILAWVAAIFGDPALVDWFALTPSYSVDNLRSWYHANTALTPEFVPGFTNQLTVGGSVFVFAMWILGLLALSILIFQRQDITS